VNLLARFEAELDSDVLLLGVSHNSNTAIHLAEQRLGRSHFYRYAKAAQEVWMELPNIPEHRHRFDEIEPSCRVATQEVLIGSCRAQGLRMILEPAQDMAVIGEATNGVETLELASSTHPDIILLDLRMPLMDGMEALTHLRRDLPECAVIVLTTFDEDILIAKAIRADVRGYLLKDTDRDTLLTAIRLAAQGEMLIAPNLLARALAHRETNTGSSPSILSTRELEVLQRVAHGERNKEIARVLHISDRTVKAHLENIFLKLEVDSRTSAVAIQSGWIAR
jgi:NarL family two-component system response regulator YdfI